MIDHIARIADTQYQKTLANIVDSFAAQYIQPIADEMDRTNNFPDKIIRKMGREGLFSIGIHKEYGGKFERLSDLLVVIDQLARYSGAIANIYGVFILSSLFSIHQWGSAEQKVKYLPKMATGECIGAFAITEESAGSDVRSIKTTAVKDGDHWILNGTKTYITAGIAADVVIVLANVHSEDSGSSRLSAFLVDSNLEGYDVGTIDSVGQRGSGLATLSFIDVALPESAILGGIGDGAKIMLQAVEFDRLIAATAAIAIAEESFYMAFDHVTTRQQFGRPLSKQQTIQFSLAEAAMQIHSVRTIIKDAVELMENNKPYNFATATAKVLGADSAVDICVKVSQLLGSAGYTKSHPIFRLIRDVRGYSIAGGTSEIQKIIIAREILNK